jgi:hypothetical protein
LPTLTFTAPPCDDSDLQLTLTGSG